MGVETFEDFEIWKLSRELYQRTREYLKDKETNDFLVSHIQRTCVSIISNIAEGFERGTNKEFARFLFISRGSCGEYRAQLYLLCDLGMIGREEFDELYLLSKKISGGITNLVKYLKGAR